MQSSNNDDVCRAVELLASMCEIDFFFSAPRCVKLQYELILYGCWEVIMPALGVLCEMLASVEGIQLAYFYKVGFCAEINNRNLYDL